MVWSSEGSVVFERIRLSLGVKKDVLAPVIDRLVAEGRIRAVELDGLVVYKPPRIEPIRRKRPGEGPNGT